MGQRFGRQQAAASSDEKPPVDMTNKNRYELYLPSIPSPDLCSLLLVTNGQQATQERCPVMNSRSSSGRWWTKEHSNGTIDNTKASNGSNLDHFYHEYLKKQPYATIVKNRANIDRINSVIRSAQNVPSLFDQQQANQLVVGGRLANFKEKNSTRQASPCKQILEACASIDQMQKAQTMQLADVLATPRLIRTNKFRQQTTNSPQASTPLLQKRQAQKNGYNYCQVDDYLANSIACSSTPSSPLPSRLERTLPLRQSLAATRHISQSPATPRKANVVRLDPPPPTPEEAEDCLAAHLRGIYNEPRTRKQRDNEDESTIPLTSIEDVNTGAAQRLGSTDVLLNTNRTSQHSLIPAMPSNRHAISRPTSAAPPPPTSHQSHMQQHPHSSSNIRQSQESLMSLMSTSTTSMAVVPGGHHSRVQQQQQQRNGGSSIGSQSPAALVRGPCRHSHHYGAHYQQRAAPASSCGSSSRDSSECSFNILGSRRQMYRRSARNLNVRIPFTDRESNGGKSPQKSAISQFLLPDLKPLPFEVPCVESSSYTSTIFVGRDWIFHEIYEILVKSSSTEYGMKGTVIFGGVGTGKTAIIHQLASYSPFLIDGEHADEFSNDSPSVSPFCSNGSPNSDRAVQPRADQPKNRTSNSTDSGFVSGSKLSLNNKPGTPSVPPRNFHLNPPPRPPLPDWHRSVCQAVIAYHFCQIENQVTCTLPEFLRNLASMFACAPQLIAYREYLSEQPKLQRLLTVDELLKNPIRSFRSAVTEPLQHLRKCGKIGPGNFLVLVDGLDEGEYHRPEFGESIGSFLVQHVLSLLPDWIKLVLTIKTGSVDLLKGLPLHKISLDDTVIDEWVYKDSKEYIRLRISQNSNIQTNVNSTKTPTNDNVQVSTCSVATASAEASSSCPLARFAAHLASGSKGNFLYMKLTLNLIEKNYLVMKGANYKVLPINLAEVFLLMFNLRFPTSRSFERVAPILNVVLASLRPFTDQELYESVAASTSNEYMDKDDFYERLKILDDYLIKKQDGTFVLFHPAFRDWLIRREDGQSPKYLCDLRYGHALLALRLSRSGHLLNAEEMQELGHHLLKAHIFKKSQAKSADDPDSSSLAALFGRNCQLLWLNQMAQDLRSSLCSRRNVCCPNSKVSRLLLLAGASADAQLINFSLDDSLDQKSDQQAPENEYATANIGSTPLLCSAAFYGQQEFASLLLEFGADVCATESYKGRCPLMLAASEGHLDMVQLLHQHGAKLSQIDNDHRCALVYAAESGHVHVVSFLLQCDWTEPSDNRLTNGDGTKNAMVCSTYGCALRQQAAQQAFVAAAGAGRTSVCEFLLDFGDVLVDEADPFGGETALSTACEQSRKETVGFLLNRAGARAAYGRQAEKPTPPLLQAVANGCWEIVSTLLARHIDVDGERNGCGQTALMVAAQHGHIAVLELLLSRNVDLSATDDDGRTALFWACLKDQTAVANMLIDRDAQIDTFDKHGFGPIHYAAQHGSKQLMQILLDRCPQLLELPTNSSAPLRPLDLAILADNIEAVQRCLKKGAKLSPSTWTFAKDKLSMIAALLKKLLEDGQLLYKRNRLDDAQHRFTYALKKLPQSPPTIGASESSVAQWSEFKPEFDRLKFHLQLNYARCQRKRGEADKAADTCTEAIRNYQQALLTAQSRKPIDLEISLVDAYICRARCFCELRQFDKAAEDLRRALRLSPANRDAQQLLPKVKSALETERLSELNVVTSSKVELSSGSSLSVYTPPQSSRESSLPVVTDNETNDINGRDYASASSPNKSNAGSDDSGNMPDIDSEAAKGNLEVNVIVKNEVDVETLL